MAKVKSFRERNEGSITLLHSHMSSKLFTKLFPRHLKRLLGTVEGSSNGGTPIAARGCGASAIFRSRRGLKTAQDGETTLALANTSKAEKRDKYKQVLIELHC